MIIVPMTTNVSGIKKILKKLGIKAKKVMN